MTTAHSEENGERARPGRTPPAPPLVECRTQSLTKRLPTVVAPVVSGEAPDTAPEAGALPETKNDWLLWQLADSTFPTGGFAHSCGLEAAWQHGEVRNRTELASFIEASLRQIGRSALLFVVAAHDSPERLREFDQICDAFTTNHVANRASRLQGAGYRVRRIFAIPENRPSTRPEVRSGRERDGSESASNFGATPHVETCDGLQTPFAHFAPMFGAIARTLGFPRETAARLFFFNHLRSLMAGAVRLNIIGPMEAQALQHRFSQTAEEIVARCESLSLDDLAQTAPLLDLWQGAQDRLYSRLFQS